MLSTVLNRRTRDANVEVIKTDLQSIKSLREEYRQEMNCQIIHDAIHRRAGWTQEYLVKSGGKSCGYASVAIGGPWKTKPAFYEYFLQPRFRTRAFELFELFLNASGARYFEVQSNDVLSTTMALTHGNGAELDAILFEDQVRTRLPAQGAVLRGVSPESEIQNAMKVRQGGGGWELLIKSEKAGSGGVLFHYNEPYGDIYMEILEPFRRRGLGSYLVQQLKKECYRRGAIPGARCHPNNLASRRTLQKAGFVPFAQLLKGTLRAAPEPR